MQNHNMCKKCITKDFLIVRGMQKGELISPIFYENMLTFKKYMELFLNGIETELLETTPLSSVKFSHFQQDKGSAHETINRTNWVNENFDK